MRIVDVGFGGGDTLRAIARWAARSNARVELFGVDSNPLAREFAEASTPDRLRITYLSNDIFYCSDPKGFDLIISSLFTHHLCDSDVVRFLKWMTFNARIAWFVNDIHRHWIPYYFIKYFTKYAPGALSFNRLIRNDAPLSVLKSFTADDWREFALRSGLSVLPEIRWHMPFRLGVYFETQVLMSEERSEGA